MESGDRRDVVVGGIIATEKSNMMQEHQTSNFYFSCRICHEDDSFEMLVGPCKCSGSLRLVHVSCLEEWLSTSNTDRCEICKFNFVIQRRDKPVPESFCKWWKTRSAYGPQGVFGDVICLFVLTPLCVASTYLCGIGASTYSRLGFWEGTGLAVLCVLLVMTYFLWFFVTLRFHFKSWRHWCERNQDVKLMVISNSNCIRFSKENFNRNRNEKDSKVSSWCTNWLQLIYKRCNGNIFNSQHQISVV